jgi:putative endonuclease
VEGFSSRYRTHRLVYCEPYGTAIEGIIREKRIKKWYRTWKIRLIEEANPNWDDLFLLINS